MPSWNASLLCVLYNEGTEKKCVLCARRKMECVICAGEKRKGVMCARERRECVFVRFKYIKKANTCNLLLIRVFLIRGRKANDEAKVKNMHDKRKSVCRRAKDTFILLG